MKHNSVLNLPLDRIAEVISISPNIEFKEPIEIIIIGCGGTGGYLIRDLSRFLYSIDRRLPGQSQITVTLYDGDLVEDKNIMRQNFMPSDIGQNKAEVMANRHVRAFAIDIQYVPEMFSFEKHGNKLNTGAQKIIIGCVDNNSARREIAKTMSYMLTSVGRSPNYNKRTIWIDSGNERKTGQVILGNAEMENVTDIFPDILDPKQDTVEVRSCAERMLEDEQNMFVNLTASNLILNYLRKVVLNENLVSNGSVFTIDNNLTNYYMVQTKSYPIK
jgi:PRTRC genetic system ThiF family protein